MTWKASDIPDLSRRTAVVTGANSGLGLETTRALALRGTHVVMAVRDLERGEAARRDVSAGMRDASLEVRHVDLASLASVRAFASALTAKHPTIDLLYNNAGVMAVPDGRTADGFETHFGVNHLAHFVLTARLLPALTRSGCARIVTVSSGARRMARNTVWADVRRGGRYRPWGAYARSKLANLQFALALDSRLRAAGLPVASLAADPGFTATNLHVGSVYYPAVGIVRRIVDVGVRGVGMSAAYGALSQLRAGTDPTATGGNLYAPRWQMFGPPVMHPVTERERDPERLEELWALSEQLTGARFEPAEVGGIEAA